MFATGITSRRTVSSSEYNIAQLMSLTIYHKICCSESDALLFCSLTICRFALAGSLELLFVEDGQVEGDGVLAAAGELVRLQVEHPPLDRLHAGVVADDVAHPAGKNVKNVRFSK